MAAMDAELEARVLAALARADAAEASGAAAHARAAALQKRLDANAHAAQRLLRVRFRRAPPAAISMRRATPVKWELDVTDDQGTTVPAVDPAAPQPAAAGKRTSTPASSSRAGLRMPPCCRMRVRRPRPVHPFVAFGTIGA